MYGGKRSIDHRAIMMGMPISSAILIPGVAGNASMHHRSSRFFGAPCALLEGAILILDFAGGQAPLILVVCILRALVFDTAEEV